MICQKCKNEVTPGNSFCNHCGTKVALQATRFCGSCGSQVAQGNRFCPSCGGSMDGRPKQAVQQRQSFRPVQPAPAPVQQQETRQAHYQQAVQVHYQQPVAPAPTYVAQQQAYMGQQERRPSDYLNIKKIRTWSAVNILLSPLLGIWAYTLVKKIETAPNEMLARKLYRKASNICVAGSLLGLIAIIIYSGM